MNLENSLYKVEPSSFQAEIDLPTSKSYANRALILGAVRGKGFKVNFLPDSSDVLTMISCLEQVGLKILRVGNSVCFMNSFPQCESETATDTIELKTGDGGTTNRFLLAMLALGKKTYRFFPSEKMNERPMDDLLSPLRELRVHLEINKNGAWIEVTGSAQIGHVTELSIDCSKSTQFASAMMLAFSQLPLSINAINVTASETYLEMTKYLLRELEQKTFLDVPVDFSSLSYPLALALIQGEVLIKNCRATDPFQADAQFIELARKWGGDIEWTPRGLRATSSKKITAFNVDGSHFPDLVPALVFLAAHIEGESVLTNLSVLRHKESDRLEELMKILRAFSIPFQFVENRDELRITGNKRTESIVSIRTARDHRMVMTAYLFLRAHNGGLLGETDCVEKSFPNFFEIMESH